MAAGFDTLNDFGFYGQLITRHTDWQARKDMLKIPADYHYLELVHEARVNDCQKNLQEIQKNKDNR
ncbi:hypothetical protein EFB08_11385 [Rufibacter latericius]|uniref:Uncharacterized protein n=1 Tax=Rufibacter latericius TaxID=2487040 RepID=A0A3M9MP44_9BACT|nr:hypothetical protein EFB08_11385 [Rufibacter latericius]